LKHPLQLGALFPSGSFLSRLMVKHIDPNTSGYVLELGPGTGSFTKALIQRGLPEEKLILIEQSPAFIALLRAKFPKSTVVLGNATQSGEILNSLGITQCDEIVSGVPLNAMDIEVRKSICTEGFKILKPGGSFVQVSYLPRCSIPSDTIMSSNAKKLFCGAVLPNLPPAFVWRAQKNSSSTVR
jgi:phosphatidylethanolamine/phosphatidyl-N-methylethanolamine N-methyltransferase